MDPSAPRTARHPFADRPPDTQAHGCTGHHILCIKYGQLPIDTPPGVCTTPTITVAAVYMAERLNSLLAHRWESFATQPYFDKQGIFISAVYSAPLLLLMFVILVRCMLLRSMSASTPSTQINYLLATIDMLIKMKRKQIRYEIRQRALQDAPPPRTKKEQ